jgi:hypothetical protein
MYLIASTSKNEGGFFLIYKSEGTQKMNVPDNDGPKKTGFHLP